MAQYRHSPAEAARTQREAVQSSYTMISESARTLQ